MTPCPVCNDSGLVFDKRESDLTGYACFADRGVCRSASRGWRRKLALDGALRARAIEQFKRGA